MGQGGSAHWRTQVRCESPQSINNPHRGAQPLPHAHGVRYAKTAGVGFAKELHHGTHDTIADKRTSETARTVVFLLAGKRDFSTINPHAA